jgi:chromosomal replication initiation ATPase DnaA
MIYTDKTTLEDVSDLISEHFKLTPYQIFKTSRKKNIIAARQVFCYIAHENTKFTLQDIAYFITIKGFRTNPYNHATIIHAKKNVKGYMSQYPKDYNLIKDIEFKLKNKYNSTLIVSDVNLLCSL